MDRLVPVFEFLERLLFVAAPHAGGDTTRDTTLGADGITEVAAPIGAVCEDLTGVVRQSIGASPAIVYVGRGDRNLFDQCGIGISANNALRLPCRRSGEPLKP